MNYDSLKTIEQEFEDFMKSYH